MKILIHRTMRLGGERVVAGDVVDVPEDDAKTALKHGWASEPPKKSAKAKAEPATETPPADGAV